MNIFPTYFNQNNFFFFFYLLFAFLFISCQEDSRVKNISDFYFPTQDLEEGMVYEYKKLGGDTLFEYWFYQTIKNDSTTYFLGQYYDNYFNIRQFIREEIISDGVILSEMFLYLPDSTDKLTKIPVNILSPTVFPFQVRDSLGVFLYKIKWKDDYPADRTTTLIKNRRYIGKDKYPYKKDFVDCVVFDVKELVETEEVGFQEIQYSGKEWYAQNIGLIYYEKQITDSFSIKYQLNDIYSAEVFEKKFNDQ